MQAADLPQLDDIAEFWAMRRTRFRRVTVQSEVRA